MAATVTNAGLAAIAALLSAFDYIAVGTGTTAAGVTDTTLETEITDSGLARAQDASPTRETTTIANDTAVADVTFTVTGTKAVTEVGLFDAGAAGNMLCREVISAINVVSGYTLIMTVKVQSVRP